MSFLHWLEEDEDVDEDDQWVMRLIEELFGKERNWDNTIIGLVPASVPAIEESEKVTITEGNSDEIRCTECLDGIKGGTEVSRLRCLHVFHGECIDRSVVKGESLLSRLPF